MLKAGTAIVDISPKKGVELAGYPHFPRYNTGVHDPLYASCIYLDDEKEKIIIIAMDLLFFSRRYVKEVRKKIGDKILIPENNIFISVSHTHSGPWAAGRMDLEALEMGLDVDREYMDKLIGKLVKIATDAFANKFYASIGTGSALCGKKEGIGGNRRNPGGPSEPAVRMVAVRDNNDKLRAALVKYSLHPTILHEDNTLVTADYPGYIREYLREKEPDMNLLFLQGTSGDQSTRYFRKGQDFNEAKRIGYKIGKAAYSGIKNIGFKKEVVLKVLSKTINLPLKKFPAKKDAELLVGETKAQWQKLADERAPYIKLQNANLKKLGAENTLGYIKLKEKKIPILLEVDELPAEVMVLSIEDTRIVGLPGEIFVEFGLKIQEKSPFKDTIVVGLANGCLPGYVYTSEAIREGGYEVGASMLSDKAGEILVRVALMLLLKSK